MTYYRALISIPINADSDEAAYEQAVAAAHRLGDDDDTILWPFGTP